jgi:N-methylhydantoinase A
MRERGPCRLGVDIRGTFTDIVLTLPDGSMTTRKVPSTPADYSVGIVECLTRLLAEYDLPGDAIDEIVHGTTVATNTILEYSGARTGLLTTAMLTRGALSRGTRGAADTV